jgi:hypothetical protein
MLCVCVCVRARVCLCVCNTHHPAGIGIQVAEPTSHRTFTHQERMLTTVTMKNILHEKYLTHTTHTVLSLRAAGLEWPRHELTPRALLNLISWRRPSSSHSTQCEWKTAKKQQVFLAKPKQKWVRQRGWVWGSGVCDDCRGTSLQLLQQGCNTGVWQYSDKYPSSSVMSARSNMYLHIRHSTHIPYLKAPW